MPTPEVGIFALGRFFHLRSLQPPRLFQAAA